MPTEQIVTLRNIIEQSLEFNTELHMNFLDFKKAFDSVHRDSLWKIVHLYGIPDHYIAIIKSLYANSQCCIRTENGNTEYFDIISGVRQGCIISPLLFLIVIDYILKTCFLIHSKTFQSKRRQNVTRFKKVFNT